MAADTKVTVAGTSYHTSKIVKTRRMIVGAAGDGSDCARMLEWAQRDFSAPPPNWRQEPGSDDSVWALILKADGLYIMTQVDEQPEKINETCFAIGSGGLAARVAMKLGKSPVEAVELAGEVDEYTGGPYDVLSLKP